jgi:hypothetical protein
VSSLKPNIIITTTITLVALVAISACSTPTPEAAKSGNEFQIGDFSVRVHKTQPDDIAQILGINRWKLSLQRKPLQEVGLMAELAISSPETGRQVIDELRIFTTEPDINALVALYPLGESLYDADEVRIYMQLGGGSSTSVIPNPFKKFSSSYTANPADVLDNKDLRLMAFSDTDPMPGPDNTILSLRIETFQE